MPVSTLSGDAKKLYETVYQSYRDDVMSEEEAAKRSWGAIKRGYRKDEETGEWVKKSFAEFSTYICKVSLDPKTNVMRWRMTASDTGEDVFGEKMSVELFRNFVERIDDGESVPLVFRSILSEKSGWSGGMPYTSVSHYKSGKDGLNIPGDVEAVYVDGETLKAKGTFRDTDLGRAVFKSVREDLDGNSKFDLPVRVSIGFLDYKHSHGDFVFERKSLADTCPMCNNGAGNKVYLDGQLVHFAFTRIPANERTDVELEEKSMADEIKTKQDDAASIVGKNLAEDLEVNKSAAEDAVNTVLVVKSDEPVVEEAKAKDVPMEDEEEMEDDEMEKGKKACKEKSALELAVESLLSGVEQAKSLGRDEALAAIQPKLDAVGEVIKAQFPEPEAPKPDPVAELISKSMADIQNMIAPLAEQVSSLATEVAILKSSKDAGKVSVETSPAIPLPRSHVATERSKALAPKSKLTQIQRIALESVGELTE